MTIIIIVVLLQKKTLHVSTLRRRFVLQVSKSQRYRFSLLVNELRNDVGVSSYLTSVLAFINCLIVSHDNINERVRIRNELIGIYAHAAFNAK